MVTGGALLGLLQQLDADPELGAATGRAAAVGDRCGWLGGARRL